MNEREIFSNTLQMSTAVERSDYLDKVCGGDFGMRKRIEILLAEQASLGSFMEHPPVKDHLSDLTGDSQAIPLTTVEPTRTTIDPGHVRLDFLAPSEKPEYLGLLGQYEILEVVGRGGMGIVLKGHDTKLNRIVAIKILAPEIASIPTAQKRFLREAQAAAAVSHDHIVTTYAVGDRPVPHLVMEYIDGCSLQQKIDAEGQLELKEVLRIGRQIASGLVAAHEQGLTHRDIKPSNVLLQNGIQRVQVTDFGLARATNDLDITRTGEVAGTPQYMSPEQAQGQLVDQRSDLFSLGSVMYAMCTGHSPFRASTPLASIRRVCDDEPRSLRENNPEIPNWLAAIIEKLLAKDPDDRFQSAAEVAELLSKCLSHLQDPGSTPFPGTIPPLKRQPAKAARPQRPWLVAALILIAVGMMLGATEATGVTNVSGTVVRIVTGEGTLVVEVDDPTVEVTLDGEELSITGAGLQELKLRPGQYQFRATKDGHPIEQKLVSISRGDREVVRVTMESSIGKATSSTDVSRTQEENDIDQLSLGEKVEHYTKLIRQRPDIALTYVYRADAYRRLGKYSNSIEDCDSAIRINPELQTAYLNRGRARYAVQMYESAIADCNEAIRLDPEEFLAYEYRGASHFGLGRYVEALANFNMSLEIKNSEMVSRLCRVQTLVMMNQLDEYRRECEPILERYRDSTVPMDYCHAARMCILAPHAINDQTRIIELAKRAVSHYPTGKQPRQWMLHTLGMAHFRAGNLDEAVRQFHASLDADPNWNAIDLIWLGLALVEQARGNNAQAQKWLRKAVEKQAAPYPQDRMEAQVLRREVEQLLNLNQAK